MPSKGSPDSLWSDVLTDRWVVRPWSSFRLLLIPIAIHLGWICLSTSRSPIAPLLFISYPVPSLTDGVTDSRYRKGLLDLLFVAYYIIFWSFVRQTITLYLCYPFARWWGIRKSGKLDRFGEQGYAMIYFAVFGAWGARIMNMQPTWWYNTSAFWLDYPHWRMTPELKCYYLMQAAYWCQQFVVLVLGLEKPRKDYRELVIHHVVTLWLVGWSYGLNLTLIGNAVYTSMDIPDTFLAISKLLNYLQLNRVKVLIFIVFMFIWTYFRHYLNVVMLWSVYKEFDLIPEASRRWAPMDGVWMVWWMKWQIFVPLLLLQFLNIFWYYYFIVRIAYRALVEETIDDDRSDDEDEEEDEKKTS